MIILKRQAPEFFDCKCDKCKAEFLYQITDIQRKEIESDVPENSFIAMAFPKDYGYVNCPCCGKEIIVSYMPNLGFSGGNQ